jgi:hypothetical protein
MLPMNCEVEYQIETDGKYEQPNQGRQMNRVGNNGCHFLLPLSCWGFCVKDAAAELIHHGPHPSATGTCDQQLT